MPGMLAKTWEPSEVHYVTPTLVILSGAFTDEEMQSIQDGVCARLDPSAIPANAVKWLKTVNGSLSSDDLQKLVLCLIGLEFWENELIDPGYVPDLPDNLTLQVIVVCKALDKKQAEIVKGVLQQVEKAIGDQLAQDVGWSMTLVWLGDVRIDLDESSAFWPRLRLGTRAHGGAVAEKERIIQECQTIVIALLTSEFRRAIEHAIGEDKKSAGWITLGASALLIDLQPMQERLQQDVLIELLKPLVKEPPSDEQRQLLENTMLDKAETFQAALLAQACEVAKDFGWALTVKGRQMEDCSYLPYSEPGCTVFGPKRWGTFIRSTFLRSAFLPGQKDMVTQLSANYLSLDETLQQRLSGLASQKYTELIEIFKSLVDRSHTPSVETLPLSMEIPWPTGLQAVVHALNTTINWLEHSPDLLKDNKGISPAPGGGQDYWNTAAESDSAQIMAGARRYQRSERTVSSWVGILLKLIPAWPLLAGLLDIITDWDIGRSVIVSGLGLIALGATELIWHVFSLRRLLERIQRQWKDCLSERVAEILAKTLADYRYQAVGRLRLIASAFDELSDLMLAKYQEIRLKREQSPKRTSQDEGTVYRLIDFRRADEWKSFAIQNANAQFPKHDGAAAGLIAQYALPLLEKPATGRIVLRILEESSEDWARQESRANLPKPYELVSDIKALREGKRWQWLWQRAQLLGDIKKGGKYFTLITLSSDAALEGAYGKNSPYWRADWFVARSRLTHEIGCIRGVIEEP